MKIIYNRQMTSFRFTVTYYSGMGYFIEAINDVRGTDLVDKSNWEIRSESKPITKGKVQNKHSFFILAL
jgi:hypothetical protein